MNSSKFEPQRIDPVLEGIHRPLWSVMIPTFNCAKYLRQTLESVLSQDPGPGQMQIEVVDDSSTNDDPEAVVREVGNGRVEFYRNPTNTGYCTLNFNVCLKRSCGHLIHILHGDDYVLPGFYSKIELLARQHPDCAIYSTRSFFVNESGVITYLSDRKPELEKPANCVRAFWFGTPIQCAGAVVRREFYEHNGGFREDLMHCADWEMWGRAWLLGNGILSPDILSCYRFFDGYDTSRFMRTAENLRDRQRCLLIFAENFPDYPVRTAQRELSQVAFEQINHMKAVGDSEAADAAMKFYRGITPWKLRFKRVVKRELMRILFE